MPQITRNLVPSIIQRRRNADLYCSYSNENLVIVLLKFDPLPNKYNIFDVLIPIKKGNGVDVPDLKFGCLKLLSVVDSVKLHEFMRVALLWICGYPLNLGVETLPFGVV